MTHPLTPREKVAKEIVDRTGVGTLGLTYEASQSVALGIADAILTALASGSGDQLSGNPGILKSGSGDHAELARLAEAASGSDWQTYISGRPEYKNVTHYVEQNPPRDLPFIAEVQEERDAAFIAAANPATVLAILAEIAALRANEKAALKECSEWARKAGEAIGKLETSEAAGIVEGWRDRATEAERKLAEAEDENNRWAFRFADVREAAGIGVKPMLSDVPGELRKMRDRLSEADQCARQIVDLKIPSGDDPEQRLKLLSLLAKAQVLARAFLSKEAERG